MKAASLRLAVPERIRVSFVDDPTDATILPLPSRRTWPIGLVFGAFFVAFAAIAVTQVASLRGEEVDTVFSLVAFLFGGFWALAWSAGVVVILLITIVLLFYSESARIEGDRLVHVPCLGPLRFFIEYDLAKVRDVRLEPGSQPAKAGLAFSYGTRKTSLGNDMPKAAAERHLEVIRRAQTELESRSGPAGVRPNPPRIDLTKWIKRRDEREPKETSRASEEAVPEGASDSSAFSASSLALLAANLVPLAGVLALGWDLGEIMTLFWAENAVIGFYSLLKLAVITRWAVLLLGPFFVGHFGGFMVGHFMFVYYLFVRGVDASGPDPSALAALTELFTPLWPALLGMLVSYGISFYTNFLRRAEFAGRTIERQMADPYKRVVILHVTIILGGWLILLLGSPLPALALLVVLKTMVDLKAHQREHAPASSSGLDNA